MLPLRKKHSALKYLAKNIPRKSKLILVNGLILSRILYILLIYSGMQVKYLNKIQIIMNKTIWFVMGLHD